MPLLHESGPLASPPALSCPLSHATQEAKDFVEGLEDKAEEDRRRKEQALEDAKADFEMELGFGKGLGKARNASAYAAPPPASDQPPLA